MIDYLTIHFHCISSQRCSETKQHKLITLAFVIDISFSFLVSWWISQTFLHRFISCCFSLNVWLEFYQIWLKNCAETLNLQLFLSLVLHRNFIISMALLWVHVIYCNPHCWFLPLVYTIRFHSDALSKQRISPFRIID